MEDLTPAEASELGELLRVLSRRIRRYAGARRVRVLYLDELGHVHLHLVPWFDEPGGSVAAPLSPARTVPEGRSPRPHTSSISQRLAEAFVTACSRIGTSRVPVRRRSQAAATPKGKVAATMIMVPPSVGSK